LRRARNAWDAWREISARLQGAGRYAFFLDFDGTLVELKRRPEDVRPSSRVNRVLSRLGAHPNVFVAIVSGRRVRDLRKLVGAPGLHYFGVHGGERDGKPLALGRASRLALSRAKRAAKARLAGLAGIWIEDKQLSFCVHFRNAGLDAERAARTALASIVTPWRGLLHVVHGQRVWEVLPREIEGKVSVVEDLLEELPAGTVAFYVGDDGTDEPALAALNNQIAIKVGSASGTQARYWLPAPAEVLRFLEHIERGIR
jgi:trehalose 6-phosphate phosphatase